MTSQEVVDLLRQASDGLQFASESEYPFEVFLWDISTPELTVPQLLEQIGRSGGTSVETIGLEELFAIALTDYTWQTAEEQQTVQQYRRLIEIINRTLDRVQVYRVGTVQVDVFIVGKTPEQHYAGLATKVIET
jgi:hypothetical protein